MEDVITILQKGGMVMIPIFFVGLYGWVLALERWWILRRLDLSGSLAAAVSRARGQGRKGMISAARVVLMEGVEGMDKGLSALAMTAYVLPLLGLLGTVTGMAATFRVITQYGVGNPALMAGGISEALLTTQAGLCVSFPLLLMHNLLSGRLEELEHLWTGQALGLVNTSGGAEAA